MEFQDLVRDIRRGRPRAIARAISVAEDGDAPARELLKVLFASRKDAAVLGITGAPGTGKSTLVDQIIVQLRAARKKIGVVAIDPSSPFSGGAILGDRIRMMRHSVDRGVFIRSMATRGHLGGLAKATGEAVTVFEAAGKDFVLVETVGVGQDEVDVVKLADLVIVVLTPGAGDDIQAFKAGIMEIADIFVINKADAPGAEKLAQQLEAMLEMGFPGREPPPVVKTVATKGDGVDALLSETRRILRTRPAGFRETRRKRLLAWMLRDILKESLFEILARRIPEAEFDRWVDRIYCRETDPYCAADHLLAVLKKELSAENRRKRD
jgi:LAO/AO transport system kinase